MLVSFTFKNFGPFREEASFDMRAIKSYKEHPYNLMDSGAKDKLLKVAAIYGANASGKSNFVEAYYCFCRIVIESFNNSDDNKKSVLSKYYTPYLFSGNDEDLNTEFEAVYIYGEHEYKYGFVYNSDKIVYEWLYRKNLGTKRSSTIYERNGNKIELGTSVRNSCSKYEKEVEKDVLVLSFFNKLRLRTAAFNDTFGCVLGFVSIKANFDYDLFLKDFFRDYFDETKKDSVLKFIQSIDVGIKDFTVEKNKVNVKIYTHHTGKDGKDYSVPIEIESDGTRKAIALYFLADFAIKIGRGLIVDELNMGLHPLLLKYIVDLFNAEGSKGQLIYTTHDTTLLDRRYFRRDQVWFVDKNEFGESSLYSLAEFKVRSDASFEKEYLGGAYGGIPILKDMEPKEGNHGL